MLILVIESHCCSEIEAASDWFLFKQQNRCTWKTLANHYSEKTINTLGRGQTFKLYLAIVPYLKRHPILKGSAESFLLLPVSTDFSAGTVRPKERKPLRSKPQSEQQQESCDRVHSQIIPGK